MFTGIIERMATIRHIQSSGSNKDFWIESDITQELRVDQSVAHNGVCLTVVEIQDDTYRVTAVDETLRKTTLGSWQIGDRLNIERCLRVGDRLDGHFVQGHVDATATCERAESLTGSWLYRFSFPEAFAALVIEKGSVCINGVSLTAFNVGGHSFTVTIIPYTHEHTTFSFLREGDAVNVEFDVLGKYLLRQAEVA